jgi:hypothetical protein
MWSSQVPYTLATLSFYLSLQRISLPNMFTKKSINPVTLPAVGCFLVFVFLLSQLSRSKVQHAFKIGLSNSVKETLSNMVYDIFNETLGVNYALHNASHLIQANFGEPLVPENLRHLTPISY